MLKFWFAAAVAIPVAIAGPAIATTLDLTTQGSSGTINGALFQQTDAQPTGSGVIDSFVRIKNTPTEQGYNTDGRPLTYDEKKSATFTHSLLLDSIPVVTIDGVDYRQFLLDVNEKASEPLLSLDAVKIFLEGVGDLTVPVDQLGTPIYDLDAGGDNFVLLNYLLNSGSGSGDMFLYVPDSVFTDAGSYVYLYSSFGANENNNAGYEEWATIQGVQAQVVPEPGSLLLLGSGLAGLGAWRARRGRRA